MIAAQSRIALPLAALALAAAAPAAWSQTLSDPDLVVETVATGLNGPTKMAFLHRDDFFICEKNTGRLLRVTHGAVAGVVLDLPVNFDAYRGLLGIALHPAFAQNGYVYLYYSRADADGGEWIENRLSRFHWSGQAFDPASETVIVAFSRDPGQTSTSGCEGGAVTFGPDGKLYGTVGDLSRGGFENPRIEQNTGDDASANSGGIFRLNDDGTIPADNPFAAHASVSIRRLFTYGMRDSFGLAFDPRTANLWQAENGPDQYDEINRADAGWNSGWLKIMGPDARNAHYARNGDTPYDASDLVYLPAAHYGDPKFSFASPVGVSALAFIPDRYYPHRLRGRLVLGEANFGGLYIFDLNESRDDLVLPPAVADDRVADSPAERNAVRWGSEFGVTSDLTVGPDGYLYEVSYIAGEVRRIRPRVPVGDMNGDGVVDNSDIDPFVLALRDRAAYQAAYPALNADITGDIDGDGGMNAFDIDGFVDLLLAG